MKHLTPVSHKSAPATATSLLEWTQIGTVVTLFVNAFNTFVTALGNYINIGPDDNWDKTAQ